MLKDTSPIQTRTHIQSLRWMNKQEIRRRCKPLVLHDKYLSVGYPSEESSNPRSGQATGMNMRERMKNKKEMRKTNNSYDEG